VIRRSAATSPNKDFIKTGKHQVFYGGADCYAYDRMAYDITMAVTSVSAGGLRSPWKISLGIVLNYWT